MNRAPKTGLRRRRAATLFADVANYSRMMSQDELNTALAVKDRLQLFREMYSQYGGELVDIAGDGVFLVFADGANAVSFSIDIQRKLEELNQSVDPSKQIRFRIGINHGEVLVDEDEISGDSVNIASRIESFAQPGRICISGALYADVNTRLGYGYEYLGAQEFKHIGRLVDVFQVHEDPTAAAMTSGLRHERGTNPDELFHEQSIVVLPFTFQGPEPQDSWFADGLTDDITTNLSRFHEFFVIARGSAYVFQNKEMSPSTIGQELRVRYVVDGSVRKVGSRIRVSIQLIDATADRALWGEQYSRDIEDLFELQDEITSVIVAATAAKIRSAEAERLRLLPPSNLEAYGFVLRGQSHAMRYTQADVRQARELYNAALSSDPKYARALSAKSRTLNLEWRYNWTAEPEAALNDSFDLAQFAVELDASDARGYGELGFAHLYRKENDASLSAYERALQLNPNDADLMSDMADAMAHSGRSEDAIAQLKRAMQLNPFYPDQYIWNLGGAYFNLKEYDLVVKTINKMQNPTEGRRLLAASYAYLNETEKANEQVEKILAAHPNFDLDQWGSIQPDKHSDDSEHFIEGLRKAGFKSSLS